MKTIAKITAALLLLGTVFGTASCGKKDFPEAIPAASALHYTLGTTVPAGSDASLSEQPSAEGTAVDDQGFADSDLNAEPDDAAAQASAEPQSDNTTKSFDPSYQTDTTVIGPRFMVIVPDYWEGNFVADLDMDIHEGAIQFYEKQNYDALKHSGHLFTLFVTSERTDDPAGMYVLIGTLVTLEGEESYVYGICATDDQCVDVPAARDIYNQMFNDYRNRNFKIETNSSDRFVQ